MIAKEEPEDVEHGSRDEESVSVFRAPDEATATMLRDFLEGQGVRASIVSVQIPWFGTIEAFPKGYWGRIDVLEHDAERARQLIEDFYAAKPEMEGTAAPDEEGGGE